MAVLLHRQLDAMIDVVVIGGGPAGLSAALMLGRCRRSVLVCDAGAPRNAASCALHGYSTRDGVAPAEFLRLARAELAPYGVRYHRAVVEAVHRTADRFEVGLAGGEKVGCRKLLIATGVEDDHPPIEGLAECYGRTVFHCPYCDGWEWRDRRLAVYGLGRAAAGLALSLQTWSRDVSLLSDGPAQLVARARAALHAQGVATCDLPIARLRHRDGRLAAVEFATGEALERDALFFTTGQHQQSAFARALGCEFTSKGTVRTRRHGQTCVPGVFVVGDASFDVQFVVVAAAEGAKAAVAINREFQDEAGQHL
jgi:thioredoxin reductase